MPNDIKDVLDKCLDRISKGESIEKCMGDYPGHAEELAPLLISALRLYSIQDIKPSENAKARARSRMERAIADRNLKKQKSPLWQWALVFARPAGIALLAIAILTTGAGATVAAASDSLPDGALYPVKRTTESVRLAFTFGDVEKARLHASYANRRAREIAVMALKQNYSDIKGLQNNLEQHLVNVQKIVSTGPEEGTLSMKSAAPVSQEGTQQDSGILMSQADTKATAQSSDITDLRTKLAAQGITSIARIEAMIPTASPEQQVLLRNMVKFMRETYSATLMASGYEIPKELQASSGE